MGNKDLSVSPFEHLSFNEAVWALERTIVECGLESGRDYITKSVGNTQVYIFISDGWKHSRIVLSPTTEDGKWTVSLKWLTATAIENKARLEAHKAEIRKLPEWQRDLYGELPNFSQQCNELWHVLYQEWRSVAKGKHNLGSTSTDTQAERMTVKPDPTDIVARARELGIHRKRYIRWRRILDIYLPQGHTQEVIAELETLAVKTIKDDYKDMRDKGLLPPYTRP